MLSIEDRELEILRAIYQSSKVITDCCVARDDGGVTINGAHSAIWNPHLQLLRCLEQELVLLSHTESKNVN